MKFFNFYKVLSILSIFTFLTSGCSTSFKDMSENEFWNENEGRFKNKTDSSYIFQVEVFDTKAEYKKINIYDEPIITSNFTKILYVNDEASYDTTLYYTVRITQQKKGHERITKPINEELYLKVNSIPMILNIKHMDIQYVPPLSSPEYGYKNGYYYCDVLCPITYEEFVLMANSIKIDGVMMVNTDIMNLNKSVDGEIKFTSTEKSGDGQIINRFYNSKPSK